MVLKRGDQNGVTEGDQCVVLEHINSDPLCSPHDTLRRSSKNSFEWDSHFNFKFRFLVNVQAPLKILKFAALRTLRQIQHATTLLGTVPYRILCCARIAHCVFLSNNLEPVPLLRIALAHVRQPGVLTSHELWLICMYTGSRAQNHINPLTVVPEKDSAHDSECT
jgi:hypothetical protein